MKPSRWVAVAAVGACAVLSARSATDQATASQRGLEQATALRPGVYVLRPLNNPDNCIETRWGGFNSNHLRTSRCPAAPTRNFLFSVVPSQYGYRVQTHSSRAEQASSRQCATTARGVVLGPARIDVGNCEAPDGAASRCALGAIDQHVWFKRVSRGVYEVRPSADDDECWSVQGNTQGEGYIVKWACHGGPDQRFELQYQGALEGENRQCTLQRGWLEGPDGLHKTVMNRATDLAGSDIRTLTAPSDAACARACVEEASCRAFTWVRPGVQGPTAQCWLKNAVPAPSRNPNTVSGVVRPAD